MGENERCGQLVAGGWFYTLCAPRLSPYAVVNLVGIRSIRWRAFGLSCVIKPLPR